MTVSLDDLEVLFLRPDAQLPQRSRDGDAGYDLRCIEPFTLEPGARTMAPTGIALAIPPGIAGLVLPRSGLAARHGITLLNSPGLIDPNYRGEVRVILHNSGGEPYEAQAGDRIAQLLLVRYWAPTLAPVDELPPSPDARGEAGF